MNESNIWNFLQQKINDEKKAALVIVSESSDSSPGRQGFKMAVSQNGEIAGTIGGGVLEAKVIKDTIAFLQTENSNQKIITLFHDPHSDALKSGLICGGSQTLIIRKLSIKDLALIKKISDVIEKKQRALLVVSKNKFEICTASGFQKKSVFTYSANFYEYKEILGRKETAYIIGGGHVGKEISRILSYLGFYVIIIEERENLFTLKSNPFADEIIQSKYSDLSDLIDSGEFSYVIIVTPKHITDKTALRAVIDQNVKYIGVMGSRKKIETIFELLKKEGVHEKLLEKVHAPIGVQIRSETPAEIAISVAAEIIKIKNSN